MFFRRSFYNILRRYYASNDIPHRALFMFQTLYTYPFGGLNEESMTIELDLCEEETERFFVLLCFYSNGIFSQFEEERNIDYESSYTTN
jgi:hypothetical protein